jgi:hypothetical protein
MAINQSLIDAINALGCTVKVRPSVVSGLNQTVISENNSQQINNSSQIQYSAKQYVSQQPIVSSQGKCCFDQSKPIKTISVSNQSKGVKSVIVQVNQFDSAIVLPANPRRKYILFSAGADLNGYAVLCPSILSGGLATYGFAIAATQQIQLSYSDAGILTTLEWIGANPLSSGNIRALYTYE